MLALLFIVCATGGGVWLATHRGSTAHATVPMDAAAVALAPVDSSPPPPPDAEPLPIVADAAPPSTPDARGHDHDRPDAHAPPPDRPDAGARPPVVRDAWVRLPGEAYAKSEIFIDGHSEGFAPNPIPTTTGTHKLEAVKPDGTVLGPITIEVKASNTRSSPYIPKF